MMKIGVIGAGNVGGNLGARLSRAGFPVRFGLKDPAADASALLARCADDAQVGSVVAAANESDVVFLALPGNVVVDVARSIAAALDGKVVVDCNNPVRWDNGPVWAPPPEGSLAAAIAKAAPGARVVKGFNGFGAEHHTDPNLTGAPADVFLAGDDAEAKKQVEAIATKAGFRPFDAGPIRNAAVLENVAVLWVHLATVGGQGRGVVLQLRGK